MTLRSLARVIAETVLLPIATYLLLITQGVMPLWALVGSATMSAAIVAIGYRRTGTLPTLGLLILCRFGVGIIVALVTGDARLTLAKDPAFTALVAVGAAATLLAGRPLSARVCRDLSDKPQHFDRMWTDNSAYRRLHRRLTTLWALGLLSESLVGFSLVYRLDFNAAVILTRLLAPIVLISLSG